MKRHYWDLKVSGNTIVIRLMNGRATLGPHYDITLCQERVSRGFSETGTHKNIRKAQLRMIRYNRKINSVFRAERKYSAELNARYNR